MKLKEITSIIANISQIVLVIVAVFGYFHTVVPVYEKSNLQESIQEKEALLTKLNKEIFNTLALTYIQDIGTSIILTPGGKREIPMPPPLVPGYASYPPLFYFEEPINPYEIIKDIADNPPQYLSSGQEVPPEVQKFVINILKEHLEKHKDNLLPSIKKDEQIRFYEQEMNGIIDFNEYKMSQEKIIIQGKYHEIFSRAYRVDFEKLVDFIKEVRASVKSGSANRQHP